MKKSFEDIVIIANASPECMIYGAGAYGKKVYQLLKVYNLEYKVKCFIVSSEPDKVDNDIDIPIIVFEKAQKLYPEATIVVAIKGAEELFKAIKQTHKGIVCFCTKNDLDVLYQKMFIHLQNNPIKNNKVFFESNYGKGYMCNGKYITEELIRQNLNVDIVWAVRDLNCEVPVSVRRVQIGTAEFYYEMATSKIWIDNCRKERYICKRNEQYYIQTWHGSGPLKKVERDAESTLSLEYIDQAKHDGEMIDLFISSTSANTYMYKNSFYSHGEILELGSPRNDLLFNSQIIDKDKIRHSIGVENKTIKIVLYAPTFRRTIENSLKAYDLDASMLIKKLEQKYGKSFVMLVRFHPNLSGNEQLKILYSDCINVTNYVDTQELLAISDVLITDYSSILWDFSLQMKPVFLYQNDEHEYLDDRGFYCPLCEWPYPRAHNSDELYKKITEFNEEEYKRNVESFFEKWKSFDDGHASERTVDRIMDVINNPQKYLKSR